MVNVGMHSHVPNHNNNGDIIVCGRERGKKKEVNIAHLLENFRKELIFYALANYSRPT